MANSAPAEGGHLGSSSEATASRGRDGLTNLPTVVNLPTANTAPFRRLKMVHRRVIALHLMGKSNAAIERALGRSSGYVSGVLNNPTVQPVLERCYRDYEREMRALFPLTVEAIRGALERGETPERLRAADLWHKIHGTYDKQKDTSQTAEDVIERILEQVNSDGTKLRVIERRKFIHATPLGDSPNDGSDSGGESGEGGDGRDLVSGVPG